MTTEAIGAIIRHGKQTWRVVYDQWYVQVFGWHPFGTIPRYSWIEIEEDRVPNEVKEAA